MAQSWPPFGMPPVSDKPPLPNGIPEEWQKANAALQAVAVQSPKSNKSSKSPASTPESKSSLAVSPAVPFGWHNPPPMCYPGFGNYAPPFTAYNYYQNYNWGQEQGQQQMSMGNNNLYNGQWNPVNSCPPPQMPSTSAEMKDEDEIQIIKEHIVKEPEKRNSLNFNQPPPQPPSSPPEASYFNNVAQAPGSGGIRFNLPKKKPNPPQNNFQTIRQSIQERLQNFSNGNSSLQNQQNVQGRPQNVQAHQQNAQAHQGAQKQVASSEYPPALKKYVEMCFNKCKTNIDKDQVEILLRGKLSKATNDGVLWTKDWTKEPLPFTHSDRLEQEASKTQLLLEKKKTPIVKSPDKKSNSPSSRLYFVDRRGQSRSPNSRSYSRSRSRSPPPRRKMIRRRRRSSSSDSGSEARNHSGGEARNHSGSEARNHRRTLSSTVITPAARTAKFTPNFYKNQKKNKKQRGNKKPFVVEPEFCTDERLQRRAARFEPKSPSRPMHSPRPYNNNNVLGNNSPFVMDLEVEDRKWMAKAVVGTCQDLEKAYFRLTCAVDPSTVRPEPVLKKSLAMVKKDWVEKQNYQFANEQLRSIRQDLVVQCISNEFTVEVYETHARIALENADKTEFNKCKSVLIVLYEVVGKGSILEFTGYQILYTMYNDDPIDLTKILSKLKPDEKKDEVVSHALKMAKAYSSNNYCRFFKLYLSAPKMSSFIVDWFIEKVRKAALKAIIKSFRPNMPVAHIQSALAFPSMKECMDFLTNAKVKFQDAGNVNCKDSGGAMANL